MTGVCKGQVEESSGGEAAAALPPLKEGKVIPNEAERNEGTHQKTHVIGNVERNLSPFANGYKRLEAIKQNK